MCHGADADTAIPDDQRAALERIRDGPPRLTRAQRRAAVRRKRVVYADDRELESEGIAPKTLMALHAKGWVEARESDDSVLWTLTPLAAARLEVKVVENATGSQQWFGREAEQPAYYRMFPGEHGTGMPFPEEVVDPRGQPAIDETSGEPMRLFEGPGRPKGVAVLIDPRLAKGMKRKRGRKR